MRFSIRSCFFVSVIGLAVSASAQVGIAPLTTFGGGDGWLAPNDNTFLQTGNNERGLAYNPVTNHVYFTSRSNSAVSVRVLDSATGAEVGTISTAGISVGTFTLNKIVVDLGDGSIYGANLRTGSTATTFRLYRWADESSAPSLIFDFLPDATGRIGDNLDLIGTGANSQIVAGYGTAATAANSNGYLVINPTASAANPTAPAFNNVTFAEGATGTNDGDFRLGITYINAPNSDSGTVLGTQGVLPGPRLTTYSGANDNGSSISGSLTGNLTLTSLNERAFDFITLGGMPLLATLDTNTSVVRLYDFSNPLSPSLLTSLTTTSGVANANANAAGDIRFGMTGLDLNNNPTATLYAMNTNNGIQAFIVTVPEPSSATLLGFSAVALGARLRRRS
jgi:hypothetical protein